jgi:hypothetical protein
VIAQRGGLYGQPSETVGARWRWSDIFRRRTRIHNDCNFSDNILYRSRATFTTRLPECTSDSDSLKLLVAL